MERLTIDEAIEHCMEKANQKYKEGMLCHANPDDGLLDGCIQCAREHEQLAEWLKELKAYKQLEEKMHKKFQGHINTETIVNSFIAFYDKQEVNEELAECLLLTNERAKEYKEYKRLQEQGLLLKLPCKVGDTVYSITRDFISEYIVESIRIYEHSIQFYWKCTKGIYHNVVGFANFDIGKAVFLTEQEAQAALEKMKAGGVNG